MSPTHTKCPYTLKALSDLPQLSAEHIIMDSLGGPSSFSVQTCKKENEKLGHTTDAKFVNDGIVAMFRTWVGVQGRNGPATWKVTGHTGKEKRPVITTFGHESVDVYHRKPFEILPDGSFKIVAPPKQSEKLYKQAKAAMEKDGYTVSDPVVTIDADQQIRGQFTHNPTICKIGLIKICYLTAFRQFGDVFLTDPSNSKWQAAIRAKTPQDLEKLNLVEMDPSAQILELFFPIPLERHQHCVAIVCWDEHVYVAARLFGFEALTFAARLSSTDICEIQHGSATVSIIDAQRKIGESLVYRDILRRILTTKNPL